MNAAYLTELKRAVETNHGCAAAHTATVPVREVFNGAVVWEGDVEVFNIIGHPRAKRCYAWGYPEEGGKAGQLEVITVLELPPVVSPLMAVRVAIASQA